MTEATKKKHNRRTPEQIVADLQAQIERVKQRAAAKEARQDPAVKLTAQAVRAIHKALGEAQEPELVQALEAAKGALAGYLDGKGLRVLKPGKKRGKREKAA